MAKQSGLGDRLYVGGVDLSGDIGSIERIGGGPAVQEVPGINVSAVERIGLLRDGGLSFTAWFNPSASREHDVLSALPTSDVGVSYLRGVSLGGSGAACVGKQIDYDATRNADGSLTWTSEVQSNAYGIEWGTQLTAGGRTDTSATNGTAVDFGAASSFGLQAYLQVEAFTGTDVTIKIQESSDNAGDAYADVVGGGFTSVTTAPGWQRIATATNLSVEQYLRVVTATSGGFTSVTFSVIVVRNTTAPSF